VPTERLRIIAAVLVASAGAILTPKTSPLMYLVALANWSGTAVLIVPKGYRLLFVAAMLEAGIAILVVQAIARIWPGR
jgi:hypothetical protein